MKLSSCFFGFAVPVAVLAHCQNDHVVGDAPKISNAVAKRNLIGLETMAKRQTILINMYTHIMFSKKPTEDLTPKILAQRAQMNRNFAPWGFQFVDMKTQWYFNEKWANSSDTLRDEKSAFAHRGDYAALNVYFMEHEQAGYCFFPLEPKAGPIDQKTLNTDGCYMGIKDGISTTSNTLTHEIGHWLGLPHTFEGGCSNTDGCDDTVKQAKPSYGTMKIPGDVNSCFTRSDQTCTPGQQDTGNLKNFMDYTDCSSQFTPCQGGRMKEAFSWRMNRELRKGVTFKKANDP